VENFKIKKLWALLFLMGALTLFYMSVENYTIASKYKEVFSMGKFAVGKLESDTSFQNFDDLDLYFRLIKNSMYYALLGVLLSSVSFLSYKLDFENRGKM